MGMDVDVDIDMGVRASALPVGRHRSRLGAWPFKGLFANNRRGIRVSMLLTGVVLLSLADLLITLTYVQANWMMEANPIAAWIIRSAPSLPMTVLALALFKTGTVAVCVSLLYRLRQSRAGEAASWAALAVLAIMAIMWHEYSAHLEDTDMVMLAQTYQHAGLLP